MSEEEAEADRFHKLFKPTGSCVDESFNCKSTAMKFEDLLTEIGEFGPYQRRVAFLVAFPTILSALEGVSTVFNFNIPPHRCAIPGFPLDQYHVMNDTHAFMLNRSIPFENGKWSQCYVYDDVNRDVNISSLHDVSGAGNGSDMTTYAKEATRSKCTRWLFDHSVFEKTIATEFDVVCDRSVLRASSNMILEVGCMTGVFLSGFVADRLGRKIPHYFGALALLCGGFGIAFTTNFITLNICRFVIGLGRITLFVNGFVIVTEIVGPSKRVFVGILMEMAWCLGMFVLLIFVYFIRNWRHLEIAMSVPAFFVLSYWWLIPESPRWLASKNRKKEVQQILEKIAASNKTKLPEIEDITSVLLKTEKFLSFRYIFTSWELIKRMLIVFSNMFILCILYYALILNITNLAGNIFVNYVISVIVESCGFAMPYFLLDRVGRKTLYCASILVAGVACVISVVPELLGAPAWVLVALSMVGKFGVSSGYSVIYIYGAELFPTVIRGTAMGIGVTFSRLGGFAAPYMADLGILVGGRLQNALPLLVMGCPALVVGMLALWLPETMATKLPEKLEDVKDLKSKQGCFCCRKNEPDGREKTLHVDGNEMTTSPC